MSLASVRQFQAVVYGYYDQHGRHDLLWRKIQPTGDVDPYHILVSEVMLQQTQVSRVTPKYQGFLKKFPTVSALASAPLGDVLKAWNGLGYNRRAKYLHQAAQQIMRDFQGQFPHTVSELIMLPGVGVNTAEAIMAYAYNAPAVFVETNIRTVFIHHFFQDKTEVSDKEIIALVHQALDQKNPRNWYWALMDYGSHLKHAVGNVNKVSKSYVKQSSFQGSNRQIRGHIIRLLASSPRNMGQLQQHISDKRLIGVLENLRREGLIKYTGSRFEL